MDTGAADGAPRAAPVDDLGGGNSQGCQPTESMIGFVTVVRRAQRDHFILRLKVPSSGATIFSDCQTSRIARKVGICLTPQTYPCLTVEAMNREGDECGADPKTT
jgi:hypothetical protein